MKRRTNKSKQFKNLNELDNLNEDGEVGFIDSDWDTKYDISEYREVAKPSKSRYSFDDLDF